MKLASDNETLAENKALILYLLNKVNKPLENTAFYKLLLTFEDMNYFYFQQFLLDLMENKYILKGTSDKNETIYEMTDEGRQAIGLVQDLIPGFTRFQIDNKFKEDLRSIEDEYSITADFIPESENSYTVVCKITENGKVTFEVRTFAGSREHAKSIVDNWKKNAVKLYPKMLKMLTK
jgi:predicted transcriptional regulator